MQNQVLSAHWSLWVPAPRFFGNVSLATVGGQQSPAAAAVREHCPPLLAVLTNKFSVYRLISVLIRYVVNTTVMVILLVFPKATFAQAGALPPYTFVGKITSYAGVQYSTNSAVEVRAKNLNGVLLAKSAIRLSDESPYNYRLTVPVASAPATGYATPGEGLIFEIFDGVATAYTSLVPAGQAVIGEPGGISVVNVALSVDTNNNGIPDQYENYIAYLMLVQGIAGPYDPEADYDGDGISNRAEFLAGTNPLNAADCLKITAAEEYENGLTADGLFAITFVSAAGRTYSVKATDDLRQINTASRDPFKTGPAVGATQTYLHTSNFQAEVITLYLIPQGATRFYRLVVE